MGTFFGLYFHFCLELALETWANAFVAHPLWVYDLNHTYSLVSFQRSGLFDHQMLTWLKLPTYPEMMPLPRVQESRQLLSARHFITMPTFFKMDYTNWWHPAKVRCHQWLKSQWPLLAHVLLHLPSTYSDESFPIFCWQITNMRARGVEFLNIPTTYYDSLREKLKTAKITVTEDLNVVCTCSLHCCYM